MGKLISLEQLAFIKGMQLVDDKVALNEVIDFSRKYKRACLILMWSLRRCMVQLPGRISIICLRGFGLMLVGCG